MQAARDAAKRAVAGAAEAAGVTRRLRREAGVAVLMFHKVTDTEDPLHLTMPPALFDRVLEEVGRHHPFVPADALGADGADPRASPGLKVAITFDDGYRDNHAHAYPILRRRGVPATIYLATDYVGGMRVFWYERVSRAVEAANVPALDLTEFGLGTLALGTQGRRREAVLYLNARLKGLSDTDRSRIVEWIGSRAGVAGEGEATAMLSWNMVREMRAGGVAFGSHTVSHPILSRESAERVARELADSKRAIEAEIGIPVCSFAYPNGTPADYTEAVVRQVAEAGYRNAYTTVAGINRAGGDPYTLRRVNVHPAMCTGPDGAFDRNLFWAKVLGLF